MPDASNLNDEADKPRSLRDRFPGHFPPSDADIMSFLTQGLVAFDTNALFDVYRFNSQARGEYLASMRLLGDRLWIPNRVAKEFLDGRLEIIRECADAISSLAEELNTPYEIIREKVRAFGNRRGLASEQMSDLESLIDKSFSDLRGAATKSFKFDLDVDGSLRTDPILKEIENLLEGKVGPPLADAKAEKEEGLKRIKEKIPPGYEDRKKEPDEAVGDYLAWRQLLEEAKRTSTPVLLVNNEQKEDWVRKFKGRMIGPRPELVAEMLQESGQPFHLIGVKSFLLHAQNYLGATVSDSTVQQAEQFDIPYEQFGYIMAQFVDLEDAITNRVFAFTRTRPKAFPEAIDLYGRLTELPREEIEELHSVRKFRNRLVHRANRRVFDKTEMEYFLALMEKHIAKARIDQLFDM